MLESYPCALGQQQRSFMRRDYGSTPPEATCTVTRTPYNVSPELHVPLLQPPHLVRARLLSLNNVGRFALYNIGELFPTRIFGFSSNSDTRFPDPPRRASSNQQSRDRKTSKLHSSQYLATDSQTPSLPKRLNSTSNSTKLSVFGLSL